MSGKLDNHSKCIKDHEVTPKKQSVATTSGTPDEPSKEAKGGKADGTSEEPPIKDGGKGDWTSEEPPIKDGGKGDGTSEEPPIKDAKKGDGTSEEPPLKDASKGDGASEEPPLKDASKGDGASEEPFPTKVLVHAINVGQGDSIVLQIEYNDGEFNTSSTISTSWAVCHPLSILLYTLSVYKVAL